MEKQEEKSESQVDVLNVLHSALQKANKEGVFTLDESYTIKTCFDGLIKKLLQLNEYVKKAEDEKLENEKQRQKFIDES